MYGRDVYVKWMVGDIGLYSQQQSHSLLRTRGKSFENLLPCFFPLPSKLASVRIIKGTIRVVFADRPRSS